MSRRSATPSGTARVRSRLRTASARIHDAVWPDERLAFIWSRSGRKNVAAVAGADIQKAPLPKTVEGCAIRFPPSGLAEHGGFPRQAKPAQVFKDQGFPFLAGPSLVNVFNAQDKLSADVLGKVMCPQGGVGVAEVQGPGR